MQVMYSQVRIGEDKIRKSEGRVLKRIRKDLLIFG
jgi:hypothetical protein